MLLAQISDLHFKRCEQRLQVFVLLRFALIDEIAGHDDGVRTRIERVQRGDATFQIRASIDAAIGERAGPFDMQVANLSQQHGVILIGARGCNARLHYDSAISASCPIEMPTGVPRASSTRPATSMSSASGAAPLIVRRVRSPRNALPSMQPRSCA